jgi:enamine deaminase RidA (YjgF/YER057c/UK114 family)
MVTLGRDAIEAEQGRVSHVDLGKLARLALLITPTSRGSFEEQAREAFDVLDLALSRQPVPMAVTVQTVFLRNPGDRAAYEAMANARWEGEMPALTFVVQPPCDGAALAVESWAIGGEAVRIERHGPGVLSVEYDGVRWICCGSAPEQAQSGGGVYQQTALALERMKAALASAGSGYEHVVRTWFYLGGITEPEADTERYKELNRARTDFYQDIPFYCSLLQPNIPHGVYPASTGIGMDGRGLAFSCLALDTRRKDVFLLPLENPQQTPAYAYHPKYSPKSPKFSRAMAFVMGTYVTVWISGTASIVNSESCHLGDAGKQTEQTLDNIERLISAENFKFHGVTGAGATLKDLAKVRVYVKRAEDYEACRAVCERRLGVAPAIYVVADVCRTDLLVEIEGVAFARRPGHRS